MRTDIRALLRSPRNAARTTHAGIGLLTRALASRRLPAPFPDHPIQWAHVSQTLHIPLPTERRSSSKRAYSCGAVAAFSAFPYIPGVFVTGRCEQTARARGDAAVFRVYNGFWSQPSAVFRHPASYTLPTFDVSRRPDVVAGHRHEDFQIQRKARKLFLTRHELRHPHRIRARSAGLTRLIPAALSRCRPAARTHHRVHDPGE